MADSIVLILANREAEYFFPDDWTGFYAACPSGKSRSDNDNLVREEAHSPFTSGDMP
jgi:hypothetical protein